MARYDLESRTANRLGDDDFMELFNDQDVTFDDMVDAMDENDTRSPRRMTPTRNAQSAISQEMLGINEEVIIKKVRKPVVKLDETRLTSAAGIPKLQKIAKTKLKFRGKGHEFSDVALLLRTYQLWLHDLYPRAKFNDGLIMLEKLGHAKSVQRLRSDWINQSKPGWQQHSDSEHDSGDAHVEPSTNIDRSTSPGQDDARAREGNDDSSTVVAQDLTATSSNQNIVMKASEPDEDELDALLAEEQELAGHDESWTGSKTAHESRPDRAQSHGDEDDFSRDEAIMRELEMWDG